LPVRKRAMKRIKPFADPCLTGIDLLASADEADNDRPIAVSAEARDEELRLGDIEVWATLLAPHEVDGLSQIPCALRLIEDRDVLDRWSLHVDEALIAKVMDVLDECSHFAN